MRYQLVQMIEGEFTVTNFGPAVDFLAAMEVRGYSFVKLNTNPRQRQELQGQPIFGQLVGPMWGGMVEGAPCVRYEDSAACDALSA